MFDIQLDWAVKISWIFGNVWFFNRFLPQQFIQNKKNQSKKKLPKEATRKNMEDSSHYTSNQIRYPLSFIESA